jgi:hypothetical protein
MLNEFVLLLILPSSRFFLHGVVVAIDVNDLRPLPNPGVIAADVMGSLNFCRRSSILYSVYLAHSLLISGGGRGSRRRLPLCLLISVRVLLLLFSSPFHRHFLLLILLVSKHMLHGKCWVPRLCW